MLDLVMILINSALVDLAWSSNTKTTTPFKPSLQTVLVLEVMGETSAQADDAL